MEQNEEIKLQEEPTKEDDKTNQQEAEKETLDSLKVINEEGKVIQALQDNESHENVVETGGEKQQAAPQKAAARFEESQKDSSRKPSLKLKPTVPQPFSLATEKRMTRERRGSVDFSSLTDKNMPQGRRGSVDFSSLTEKNMPKGRRGSVDFEESQPKLTKTLSLNRKIQSLPGPGLGETSKLKQTDFTAAATTKTSSTVKVSITERGDKETENTNLKKKNKILVNKEVESRYLKVTAKKQQGEELANKDKLRKSTTFKASPLPSFYQRKDSHSKPEINKKSPVLGQKSKSMPNGDKLKLEEKGKTVSRTKETITKLFKSTKRTLIGSKETVKGTIVAGA